MKKNSNRFSLFGLSFMVLVLMQTGCDTNPSASHPESLYAPVPENETMHEETNLLPAAANHDAIVVHKAYTLEYDEEYEQARWVAYMLTSKHSRGNVQRTDFFVQDPLVNTQSAHFEDYRRSGYTKGHMAPAGDMKWDTTAMRESFYMSNMSPQTAAFNDGIWNKIEMQVRQWARDYDSVYVVTGPIIEPDHEVIGRNKVAVPSYFYKVVYAPTKQQGIAFLVRHQSSNKSPRQFAVSIDQIESRSGIDFFPALPDKLEESMESSVCTDCWQWRTFTD